MKRGHKLLGEVAKTLGLASMMAQIGQRLPAEHHLLDAFDMLMDWRRALNDGTLSVEDEG